MKIMRIVLVLVLSMSLFLPAFAYTEALEAPIDEIEGQINEIEDSTLEEAYQEDTVILGEDEDEIASESLETYGAVSYGYEPDEYDYSFYKKSISGSFNLYIGDTLDIWKFDSNYNELTGKSWKSSKPSVATISDRGGYYRVAALKAGESKITVKMKEGHKLSLKVKVKDPYVPDTVKLNASSITLYVGDTFTLTSTLSPSFARTTYTWSTSSKKVATVSNGYVTALKKGSAKITVKTANGKKATCKVTVKSGSKPLPVSSELSSYFGQKLSTVASTLGLTSKIIEDDYIGYQGSNFEIGCMTSTSYSNAKMDATAIYGPCNYSICGVKYGKGILITMSELEKNGWHREDAGDYLEYVSYSKGYYNMYIESEGGAIDFIFLDEEHWAN